MMFELGSTTLLPDIVSQEPSLTVTDRVELPTGSNETTAEPDPALPTDTDQLTTSSTGLDTTDLFPEFLPVGNRTSDALVITRTGGLEDDLTVGSGDGEILDMTGSTSTTVGDLHGLRPLLLSTGSPGLLHHFTTLSPDREAKWRRSAQACRPQARPLLPLITIPVMYTRLGELPFPCIPSTPPHPLPSTIKVCFR